MSDSSERNWIYGGVIAAVVVLLVLMLAVYDYDRRNNTADQLASELIGRFDAAGLPTPLDAETVARVLGDDGGAVCDTADSSFAHGLLRLHLGVGGNFYQRAVQIDRRVLEGQLLIVQTYCPDKLDDFQDFVDSHEFDDVIRD